MATPRWEPARLYPPGSLVVPRTDPPPPGYALTNGGFEDGATDWTLGAGASIDSGEHYSGTQSLEIGGSFGVSDTIHDASPVVPGRAISARAMYAQGAASAGNNGGLIVLQFLDASDALVGPEFLGNVVTNSSGGNWKQTLVNGLAPAGSTQVRIVLRSNRSHSEQSWFDAVTWDYGAATVPSGLVYRAVQPAIGYSAADEPVWPLTLGVTVVDNEVIWEAVQANRVIWEAEPIMVSGPIEPIWPTALGAHISDNTVDWEAVSRRVEDPNCPNSPIVQIDHSKIYMADDDIAPYCGTNNPLDWTTPDDAGYLPVNMNPFGGNPIKAFASYRSNMLIFNAQGMQTWQLDEDPALSALLDSLPIPCTQHKSIASVANDSMILTPLGVRSIGIAANSTNLKAGDIGMPVDSLILAAWKSAIALNSEPRGLYWPASGQYWLIFKMPGTGPDFLIEDKDGVIQRTPYVWESQVFVYTISQLGSVGAWSRYLFPFGIDEWIIDDVNLVLRAGDLILEMDNDPNSEFFNDYEWDGPGVKPEGVPQDEPFVGQVWWPWLDFGAPGVDKNLEYFDYTGDGAAVFEVGYAQDTSRQTPGWFTDPYPLIPDTVTGDFIPFEVTAPSMSIRLTYNGGERWRLLALSLYMQGRK